MKPDGEMTNEELVQLALAAYSKGWEEAEGEKPPPEYLVALRIQLEQMGEDDEPDRAESLIRALRGRN